MVIRTLMLLLCLSASSCAQPNPPPEAPVREPRPATTEEVVVLATPGQVSLDQISATMGRESSFRFVARMPQLAAAGLIDPLIDLIPPGHRTTYEQFVAASGFDLKTMVRGAYVYADTDGEGLDFTNGSIVLAVDGVSVDKLVSASEILEESENPDDPETADDTDVGSAIVLIELSDADRALLLKDLRTSDDNLIEDVGNATVVVQMDGESRYCGYLWPGGFVYRSMPESVPSSLLAAKKVLAPVIAELAQASSRKPRDTNDAVEGRMLVEKRELVFSGQIAERLTARIVVQLLPDDVETTEAFLENLPAIRARPQKALTAFAPASRPLAEFLFSGSEFGLSGEELTIEIAVDAERFKDLLSPLL